MSQFLDELSGDFLGDKNFILDLPLRYESDYLKCIITVPAGFVTDFASFQIADMSMSTGKRSATLHDYFYRTQGVLSKKKADWVFLEALKSQGVGVVRRWKMYLGVRWFGHSSYKGGVKD